MVLLSARDTTFLGLYSTWGRRRSTCPFRERQSLKRLTAMGSLPAESILWCPA